MFNPKGSGSCHECDLSQGDRKGLQLKSNLTGPINQASTGDMVPKSKHTYFPYPSHNKSDQDRSRGTETDHSQSQKNDYTHTCNAYTTKSGQEALYL